jgi:hypothetical protein
VDIFRLFRFAAAVCAVAAIGAFQPAEAQFADLDSPAAASAMEGAESGVVLLSADELREIVAPVALYPDDLLAIVLPAATQPLQIVEADRFLEKRKATPDLAPNENWDPAILALLNYPEVVELMNEDLAWTQSLGNAVMDQQDDVLKAIQEARSSATSAGYLQSDEKQTVVTEQETIIIKSSDPEVIYVPTYDPQPIIENTYVNYPPPVYSTPYPYYYAPAATFMAGMFVGAAFSYGFDWNNNDIDIDCCEGGGNNNNINIGNGNTNVDRDKLQNRFSGDRNPKAKNGNGMKWSPQKARQKSSAPRAANTSARPNSAGIAKQLGSGGTGGGAKVGSGSTNVRKHTPPSTRPSAETRRDSQRGNQSLGQNKPQRQQQLQQKQQQKRQVQPQRQQRQLNQAPQRPKASSFSQMPKQQTVRQQSSRGNRSMGGGSKTPRRR